MNLFPILRVSVREDAEEMRGCLSCLPSLSSIWICCLYVSCTLRVYIFRCSQPLCVLVCVLLPFVLALVFRKRDYVKGGVRMPIGFYFGTDVMAARARFVSTGRAMEHRWEVRVWYRGDDFYCYYQLRRFTSLLRCAYLWRPGLCRFICTATSPPPRCMQPQQYDTR